MDRSVGALIYFPRSGSTLLARLLMEASPDVLVMPETRLPQFLAQLPAMRDPAAKLDRQQLSALIEADHQFANLGFTDAQVAAFVAENDGADPGTVLRHLVDLYVETTGTAPALVLLKNGLLIHAGDALARTFGSQLFVHIRRDGRGAVSSMLKTKAAYGAKRTMGRDDPLACARSWAGYMRKAQSLSADQGFLELTYEGLLGAPEATVEALLDRLERTIGRPLRRGASHGTFAVSASESGLHPLVQQAEDKSRLDGWQTELAGWRGVATEWVAKDELQRLGYPPHFLVGGGKATVPMAVAQAYLQHARVKLGQALTRKRLR